MQQVSKMLMPPLRTKLAFEIILIILGVSFFWNQDLAKFLNWEKTTQNRPFTIVWILNFWRSELVRENNYNATVSISLEGNDRP